jgi:glycosyltransferase involved in cell wall biosynthesis
MTTPRISIVVPTHNRPALLLEAVQSIAAQTVAEWEAIVVDDASAPPVDAGALPAPLGRKIRVLRHAASRGGAAAKNTGLREAVAPVVAFLDDDDLYEARYVERALAVLDGHPEIDVVFMAISHVGSRAHEAEQGYQAAMSNTLRRAAGTEAEPGVVIFGAALFGALLISIPMAFQRPVVRRTALDEIGEYRPDCLLWDNDWALRAALRGRTALLNEPLYRQRVHDRAFSSRGRKLEQLLSQVEIKDRLLATLRETRAPQRGLARRAAAEAWFRLAYHQSATGHQREALAAWLVSERRRPSFQHCKLLPRLAQRALLRPKAA